MTALWASSGDSDKHDNGNGNNHNCAKSQLKCKPRTQPPTGLSGEKLFETSLPQMHVAVNRATFQSGRRCYFLATLTGHIYRKCDDDPTNQVLWIDASASVASFGLGEEGFLGFAVSPNGKRAYMHYISEVNSSWTPGSEYFDVLCNRTFYYPPLDEWLTRPMAGIFVVVEWELNGPNDVPSSPKTLLNYSASDLRHCGVDTLRLLDNNRLLFTAGESQTYWDVGRFTNQSSIFGKTWLIDLQKRHNTGDMTTAVRSVVDLPAAIHHSMKIVMSSIRNGAAPVYDLDVYKNDDPLLLQWMMGHASGDMIYGLRGIDSSRFTGWPAYSGLGWTSTYHYPECSAPASAGMQLTNRNSDSSSYGFLDEWLAGGRQAYERAREQVRVQIEIIGQTFVPFVAHVLVYGSLWRYEEQRHLPLGFTPGWLAPDTGPSDPVSGSPAGLIGGGLIRLKPDECPIAISGAFQTLYAEDDGFTSARDPVASANAGFTVGPPHLSVWVPDWTQPEKQAVTYDFTTDPIFQGYYGGPGRYFMTSLSSSPDHDEFYLSLYTRPAPSSAMPLVAQTWVAKFED